MTPRQSFDRSSPLGPDEQELQRRLQQLERDVAGIPRSLPSPGPITPNDDLPTHGHRSSSRLDRRGFRVAKFMVLALVGLVAVNLLVQVATRLIALGLLVGLGWLIYQAVTSRDA